MELDENKQVYVTYHISYVGKSGNKPIYVDIGDLSQWMQQQGRKGMFAPHSSILLLDEGYAGMDSRSSSSTANKMLSYFVFQSRKLGLDLLVACQLASCLTGDTKLEYADGSFREIRDARIGDDLVDHTYWGNTIRKVTTIRKMMTNRTYTIVLESGHRVTATADHRLPVQIRGQIDSLTRAEDLQVGDWLKVDNWRSQLEVDPVACLFGVVLAEGSWRIGEPFSFIDHRRNRRYHGKFYQLTFSISCEEIELRRFIEDTLKKLIPNVHVCCMKSKTSKGFQLVVSKTSHVIYLREIYERFIASKEHSSCELASFLRGVFEGDGCVSHTVKTRTGYAGSVALTQGEVNAWKIDLVKSYLTRLNMPFNEERQIRSTCWHSDREHLVCHLKITPARLSAFQGKIGFISKTKTDKLSSLIKNHYARISEIQISDNSVLVYDISVARQDPRRPHLVTKNDPAPYYFANGIRVHNSLDKRIRNLTDAWILAELLPRQDEQGNLMKCPDCGNEVDDFRYTFASVDGSANEFWLEHEKAHEIFKWYSTMEIVQPPMMALDKKEALRAKQAVQRQGIAARRKQKSEITPD